MRQRGKSATQIVWNKTSREKSVHGLSDNLANKVIYRIVTKFQEVFNSHSMLSPLMNDIFNHPFFLDSKAVHLHILNHPAFNLQAIPIISSLKPTVWSIHDPWILSGHCIHHKDCQKWQSHCNSCPMLQIPYPISQDNTALQHAQKKSVIKSSKFIAHVASNWMKEKLQASPAFEGKKIRVIPFGVRQEVFFPGPGDAFRRRHGIGMGTKVVLARISSNYKGQDTIFQAIRKVADNIGEFTLLLVGEKLPRGHGIPKSVRVIQMGWLKDPTVLAEAYRACEVFLMPSEQETFGLMAAEAMSCGKVVLAIQDAGSALEETINSPECGLAVRKEDYPDALLKLLVDPQSREARELNSLAWARREYSWDTYIDRMENLYKEAVDEFTETPESKIIVDQLRLHASKYRAHYFSQASTKPGIREFSKLVNAVKKNGFRWLLAQGWSLAWWKITAAYSK
jgi:glycosyltransferase involved in cell wall biosynthesis